MAKNNFNNTLAPVSFSNKSLPGGDSSPSPMSFNRKKSATDGGGETRQKGYRPSEVMNGEGGK